MKTRPLADLLQVFIGPGLWFAHFSIVYGAEPLICRDAARGTLMVLTGTAATLAALAALALFAFVLVRERRADASFLRGVALLLALLAILGVVWTALPLVLVQACVTP